MTGDSRLLEIFLEVQRGLPRQGPGNDEATLRALGCCRDLPPAPAVLDIGCGPGRQTLALAGALPGPITAVDVFPEYLDELTARAAAAGLSDRITASRADMNDLPFPPASFDLLWSEGAAYIMGVENALRSWKPLLKPGGCLVFSELLWLRPDPPMEVGAFFKQEYPAMGNVASNAALVEKYGYRLLDHFTLPDRAWWDDYYGPLEAKLPGLREKYRDDSEALGLVAMTEREIEMRRRFPEAYGYEFFIAQVSALK